MEAVFVVATLTSVGLAFVLVTVAWRVLREEGRRSAARVAALAAALPEQPAATRAEPTASEELESERRAVEGRPFAQAATGLGDNGRLMLDHDSPLAEFGSEDAPPPPVRAQKVAEFRSSRDGAVGRSDSLIDAIDSARREVGVGDAATSTPGTVLFSSGPRSEEALGSNISSSETPSNSVSHGPGGHQWRWIAGIAAGVALVVGTWSIILSDARPSATTAVAEPRQASPLELVSLTHQRNASGLTVAGLVRNPESGTAARNVTAVVFVFDRQGQFSASARAPIDFTLLGPGEESPFSIKVDTSGSIGRYRVSFRSDEGRALPHVDQREHSSVPSSRSAPTSGRPS